MKFPSAPPVTRSRRGRQRGLVSLFGGLLGRVESDRDSDQHLFGIRPRHFEAQNFEVPTEVPRFHRQVNDGVGPDDGGFLAEMTAQGFPAEGFSFKRGAGCLNVCEPPIGPIGLALDDLDPVVVAFTGFFTAVEIQMVGEIARIARTANAPREANHEGTQHKGLANGLQPLKSLADRKFKLRFPWVR